jgi:hypothetical protein
MFKYSKNIKMKLQSKSLFTLLILVTLLTLPLILAPTTNDPLENFFDDEQNLEDFKELEGEDKNKLWEESKDALKKNAIASKMAKDIINEKILGDKVELNDALKHSARNWLNRYIKEGGTSLGKYTIPETGVEIDLKVDSLGAIDRIASEAGISLGFSSTTKLETVRGFGDPDLKWEEGNKNIITNGKVSLDLENLPIGTQSIEYKNGKFHIGLASGGTVILEENPEMDSFVLGDAIFLAEEGESITVTKEGFKLEGNSEIHYIGLTLTKNPKSAEGFIKITKDGFYLKDAKVKIENPTGEGFIEMIADNDEKFLRITNGQALTSKVLESVKEGMMANANSPVTKVIHFDDGEKRLSHKEIFTGSARIGPSYNPTLTRESLGDVYFSFNEETGEVIGIKKNGNWVTIGNSMTEDLQKIYTASSDTVQQIITDSLESEKTVDYAYIRSARNKDLWLRKGEKIHVDTKVLDGVSMSFDKSGEVTHVSKAGVNNGEWVEFFRSDDLSKIYETSSERVNYYLKRGRSETNIPDLNDFIANTVPPNEKDFMIIAGDNVLMGGDVEVNIQQDLESLNFYNLDNNAKVNVNGLKLSANTQGKLEYQRAPVKTNEFNVDYVSITNQKSDGSSITSAHTYQILDQKGDEANTPIIYSDRFVAGREVFTGPFGVTVDAYVSMSQESVERTGINHMQDRGDIQDTLDNEGYEFRLDAKIPVSGVGIKINDKDKLLDEVILPGLEDWVLGVVLPIPEQEEWWKKVGQNLLFLGDERQVKLQVSQTLNDLVRSSVRDEYNSGELGIGFRHVPNGNPQIIVYENGEVVDTVNLKGEDAELVGDILEMIRIGPYFTQTSNNKKRLWGQNIGNKVNINRGMGVGDWINTLNFVEKYSTKYNN